MAVKKILVVDDEKKIRELLELRLLSAGYEVIQAQDGEELLEENEPGKRGERLALELDHREGMGLTADLGSAKLHLADLLVAFGCSNVFYTRQGVRFAFFVDSL